MATYRHLTGRRRAEQEHFLGELDEHDVRADFVDDALLLTLDADLELSGVPAPENATADAKSAMDATSSVAIDLTGTTTAFDISNAETRTLTATLKRGSDTVTTDDSTVVTFAKTAGTGTVGGLGTDTATDGVASIDVTSASQEAGSITITASAPGYASDSITFTVQA